MSQELVEQQQEVNGKEPEDFEQAKDIFRFFGDIMTESSERATRQLHAKHKLDNVAIFVDYDNVYWTLINNYSHDPDHEEREKNLFVKLWERYGQDNIRTFRAYADFQKIRTNMTSLQKKRIQLRHVYSNDKEGDGRKNSSDIEMCIDAIESTFKDSNIGTYVFVTADSDMIPILSRMMYKGKRVELFYLSKAAPRHVDITSYAHYAQDLLEFLSVELKEHSVEDYVLRALLIIQRWEIDFNHTDRYLGKPYLRSQLVKNFGIPAETCSEIIERLLMDEYVHETRKRLSNGETKPSLALSEKGRHCLSADAAVAATVSESE